MPVLAIDARALARTGVAAGLLIASLPSCSTESAKRGPCLRTVATGQTGATGIAIGGANVYWVSEVQGTLLGAPLTGGQATVLAFGQDHPVAVTASGDRLFWLDAGMEYREGSLMMVPVGGGAPAVLASRLSQPTAIAVDGSRVYWTDLEAGSVMTVPTSGGTVVTLVSGLHLPLGLAAKDGMGYVTSFGDGTVMRVPADGSPPMTLATDQNGPESIAVDDTSVYFTTIDDGAHGKVMKLPLNGGTPVVLASNQAGPRSIAVDSGIVYWLSGGEAGGRVVEVPTAGGVPTIVSDTDHVPTALAVHGASIAWTTSTEQTVPPAGSVATLALEAATCGAAQPMDEDAGAEACSASCRGTCSHGRCITSVATVTAPSALVADARNVYWSDFPGAATPGQPVWSVMQAPVDGGAITMLAAAQVAPHALAVGTSSVYWTSPSESMVKEVPIGGGSVATLATGGMPRGIAVDAANVYWTDSSNHAVMKIPVQGGAPVQFATTEQPAYVLALDARNVYWSEADGPIVKASIDGGPPSTLAQGQAPAAFALDDLCLYWFNRSTYSGDAPDSGSTSGSVMRVFIEGGTPVTLASGLHNPDGVAVDGANVYFIDDELTLVPKAGGVPTVLDLGGPTVLVAVGAGALFSVAGTDIVRIAAR